MVKADLKHWGGRRGADGPYEIDYERFVNQAYDKLGAGGVVGIPNARGPDNPLGAEYRFEELFEMAQKESSIIPLGDGRVFRDEEYGVWFVKSQEINSQFKDKKLTYLTFNIPFRENFNEGNNEALYNSDTINVLTLPSCIEQIDGISPLLPYFKGIITHSSSAAILPGVNKKSEEFYNDSIKNNFFYIPEGLIHFIGAIAVSGGHRSPKEGLFQKIVSPISIGSSYTLFPEFNGNTLWEFNTWLRESIQNSQDTDKLVKGSSMREMLSRHLPRMLQGILYGERKTIF